MIGAESSVRNNKKQFIVIAGIILAILLLGGGIFMAVKYYQDDKNTITRDEADSTTKDILNKVGELYVLPTGEEPTVAEIQDTTKLADQSFFDKSQNGDYLLVYTNAKLALIYRSSIDKLINAGPVNIDEDTEGTEVTQ